MSKLKLKGKELRAIGFPEGPVISIAMNIMEKSFKHKDKAEALQLLRQILAEPKKGRGGKKSAGSGTSTRRRNRIQRDP